MTTGSGLLEGLNPAQKEAVETVDGPLLIVAGPGSGKTRVITHRIAYLVREYEISPFNILAMTFTNKAAREMRERLDRLVGSRSDALTVGTFHSFCAKVLRIDGHNLGLDTNYSIYDADDQAKIIKDSMELAEIDPKRNPPRAILSMISNAKNKMWDSRTFTKNADNYFEEICAQVYHHYEEALTRNNAVDFDDLLMKTVQLLREFPGVRTKYNDRYKYIMVDEFQDTNISQYQLARLLAESHQNICVVGDPDQSIYSWRSADIRNILSFQGDYPQAKTIALDQNYRSTANILDAAKNLISINGQRIQKDLFTDNSKGDLVEIREAYDEGEEASFVISEAERLVRENGYKHGDCAVMYRINAQSRALEEACLHQGTRYRLVGGIRFYKRREVKDLMAYLHLVYNPNDDVNLGRVINVPPRGIGAKSMQQMGDWARSKNLGLFAAMQEVAAARLAGEDCPITITKKAATSFADFAVTLEKLIELSKREKVVDLVDRVVEDTGFRNFIQNSDDSPQERWENIMELRATAQEFNAEAPPDGLATLLERLSLVADMDNYEDADDSITLITLHQAKGLEFPVVFMVGMEEGLLPHSRSLDDEDQLEEERRLCYVGMTRAEKLLYLTRAFRRSIFGATRAGEGSRFLRDIPAELITSGSGPTNGSAGGTSRSFGKPGESKGPSWNTWQAPTPVINRAKPESARPTLSVGDSVRHNAFGEGVVTRVDVTASDTEVTIEFEGGVGQKRLLLSFAPLEKIG
ncbi:MAG: AAA family ATPase [SAR202 cluster bacterium]|nr:UvrD-helicase domain-containing protein [Dehalococcoidia bacterium]MQF92572.1 AAA family ATPase [SAR202 cluster bacterium]MQG61412.1 AAA family ATPase [SAR202 cluster bacterium]